MSIEKEAAFLNGIANFAKNRLRYAKREIQRATPYIRQSGEAGGLAIHRNIIDGLAKADAFGAPTASKALTKLASGLTAADTGLGAMVRGRSKSGLWHDMWTSKSKYKVHMETKNGKNVLVPGAGKDGKVLYREIERPSIMKPVAGAGALATGVLAQMKGTELLDKLRSKPQEQ